MTDRKKHWFKPVVLTVVLLGAGGLGVAAAKSDGWGHDRCGARHGAAMHGHGMFMPGRYVEGKLAFLKTELAITAEQEQAWEEFAGVVRKSAEARAEKWRAHRERRKEEKGSESAERPDLDERIDRRLAAMDKHVAMLTEMGGAAKKLYAELTPEQQEIADDMFPLRRGHGRHFRF